MQVTKINYYGMQQKIATYKNDKSLVKTNFTDKDVNNLKMYKNCQPSSIFICYLLYKIRKLNKLIYFVLLSAVT